MRPYSVLSVGRFEQETYILLVLTLFNLCGLKKNCNDLKLWRLLYSLFSWICLEWWLLLLRLSPNLYALFVLCFFLFFFVFVLFFLSCWRVLLSSLSSLLDCSTVAPPTPSFMKDSALYIGFELLIFVLHFSAAVSPFEPKKNTNRLHGINKNTEHAYSNINWSILD